MALRAWLAKVEGKSLNLGAAKHSARRNSTLSTSNTVVCNALCTGHHVLQFVASSAMSAINQSSHVSSNFSSQETFVDSSRAPYFVTSELEHLIKLDKQCYCVCVSLLEVTKNVVESYLQPNGLRVWHAKNHKISLETHFKLHYLEMLPTVPLNFSTKITLFQHVQ